MNGRTEELEWDYKEGKEVRNSYTDAEVSIKKAKQKKI